MNAQTILTFIEEVHCLKDLPRTGWLLRGVKPCESIADHCYGMVTLAMVLADVLVEQGVELDADKVIRMAVVHEFGEARITDLPFPAMRHLPDEAKHKAERSAIVDMVKGFAGVGERYVSLWDEFEVAETLEAKIVRVADKLEMLVQAYRYEQAGYRSLGGFWENKLNQQYTDIHPLLTDIIAYLIDRRANSANSKRE